MRDRNKVKLQRIHASGIDCVLLNCILDNCWLFMDIYAHTVYISIFDLVTPSRIEWTMR